MTKNLFVALLMSSLPMAAMAEAGVSAGKGMNAPRAGESDAAYKALIDSAPQREAAMQKKVDAGESAYAMDPTTQRLQHDLDTARNVQKAAADRYMKEPSPFGEQQVNASSARLKSLREALEKHRADYLAAHPDFNRDVQMLREMKRAHAEIRAKHGSASNLLDKENMLRN